MNEERQRNINDAYKYLKCKYPDPPFVTPAKIRTEIETKFSLSEDEAVVVYDTWKERDLGMSCPKRRKGKGKFNETKIPKGEITYRFKWSKNLEKLKELHERYKEGEDVEKLAKEVLVSKDCLLNAFSAHKKKGVLHGRKKVKKQYVLVKGKRLSFEEVGNIIKRIRNGEKRIRIANELRVNRSYIDNFYIRFKDKF